MKLTTNIIKMFTIKKIVAKKATFLFSIPFSPLDNKENKYTKPMINSVHVNISNQSRAFILLFFLNSFIKIDLFTSLKLEFNLSCIFLLCSVKLFLWSFFKFLMSFLFIPLKSLKLAPCFLLTISVSYKYCDFQKGELCLSLLKI